jgi:FAD/FMN-containing dehydrogenase
MFDSGVDFTIIRGGTAGIAVSLIVEKLREMLGDDAIVAGSAVSTHAANYWDPSPLQAKALVRPKSTAQVSQVMQLCHAAGQSVVVHGGLTGVCSGDRSTAQDIVLSLLRLNKIEEIDFVGSTATVQAGCVLRVVQEAAAHAGLYFPLDLGARGSCTVGGNAATNAGGINVIRYGMMRDQVLGLETVLADGTVVSSMNRMLKNNAGYDLKQLFVGSEGTLGIITRLVLRLRQETPHANTAFVALSSFEKVSELLICMTRRLAGSLSSFEVMWGDYFRAVTETGGHRPPLGRGYPFYVVMEAHGVEQDVDSARFEKALQAALKEGLIEDAVVPNSKQERDKLWAVREDFSAILRDKPQFLYDVSLPIRDMAAYVQTVTTGLKQRWPASRFYVLGHIGDGNLHFFVSPGIEAENLHRDVDELVYAPLQGIGGSISAEHGIGFEKRDYLALSRTPEELEMMRAIKRMLDPKNILNPGKVI